MEASSPDANLAVPKSEAFPRYPQSWYWVCSSRDLARGKSVAVRLCGRSLVVFRTARDQLGALASRCPHLGADLSSGQVVGDRIECPHHRFKFGPRGECPEQGLQATLTTPRNAMVRSSFSTARLHCSRCRDFPTMTTWSVQSRSLETEYPVVHDRGQRLRRPTFCIRP